MTIDLKVIIISSSKHPKHTMWPTYHRSFFELFHEVRWQFPGGFVDFGSVSNDDLRLWIFSFGDQPSGGLLDDSALGVQREFTVK